MKLARFVNTYENHPDDDMKTHWYDARYDECRNAIIDIARDFQMNIVNINDEYKEIFVVNSKYKLMIKVTEYTFHETSIDLYLEKLSAFDLGAWRRFIARWHDRLGHKLPFIGIALHP